MNVARMLNIETKSHNHWLKRGRKLLNLKTIVLEDGTRCVYSPLFDGGLVRRVRKQMNDVINNDGC